MAQGSLRVSVARSARNCAAASSSRNAAFLARAPDAALVGAARRWVGSLADTGPGRAAAVLEAAALRTWPLALAIDPLRSRPAEALPSRQSDIDVDRVDLHRVAVGAGALGGDERGPRAGEGLVERVTTPQVIADRSLEEDEGLLSRVVESWLVGACHDHLGAGSVPDRRLVPGAEEPDLGALPPHHPAGLVAPVIPAPPHREEALVPDHLGHDLEADPLQPLGHLRGMDAGVPDVADDEGGHEFERFGPVDSGVARHRRVAGALSAHVCFLGRRAGVGHALVTG